MKVFIPFTMFHRIFSSFKYNLLRIEEVENKGGGDGVGDGGRGGGSYFQCCCFSIYVNI